jgi:hypothetical protein
MGTALRAATRRFVATAAGLAIGVAGLALGAAPAAAAAPGGPFHFSAPTRVFDSRTNGTPGGSLEAGPIDILAGLAGSFVTIGAGAPDHAGSVLFGPCGGEVDTVLRFEAGTFASTMQFVEPDTCVTLTASAQVVVDVGNRMSADDDTGYRYFDLDEPADVFDSFAAAAPLTTGESRISLSGVVPAGAGGIAVHLSGYTYDENGGGYAVAYDCGSARPGIAHINLNSLTASDAIAYVPLAEAADLCLYLYASDEADVSVSVLGYFTDTEAEGGATPPTLVYRSDLAPGFEPVAPVRVLDTRSGLGAPTGKVAGGTTVALDLSDRVSEGTTAVVLNVTATDTEGWGYVTVYSCDSDRPDTSNVNFDGAGQNVPNQVTVDAGADGHVCLFASATTNLLADLAGTYEYGHGQRFTPTDPTRILDTRAGIGAPVAHVTAGQTLVLQVSGQAGVPSGAGAVTMNLTAVGALGWGYVTAYPCDAAQPDASNINYVPGQTVPNLVTVKLSAAGTVCLFSFADVDLLADVAGYYDTNPAGAGLVVYAPYRLFDSRIDGEPLDWQYYYAFQVTDADPTTLAVVTNLTVNAPAGPGYLTAYPCTDDGEAPNASNVNYETDQTVANQAVVKLSASGQMCVVTWDVTDAIIDVFAAFSTDRIWYQVLRDDVSALPLGEATDPGETSDPAADEPDPFDDAVTVPDLEPATIDAPVRKPTATRNSSTR